MKNFIKSAICDGQATRLVTIECSSTRGFPGLHLLGNTDAICREGRERARTVLENEGLQLPPRRLVLSLAPADIPKDGNHFDLAFALVLAVLIRGNPPGHDPRKWLFAAELGLDGGLRPVRRIIPFAIEAVRQGLRGIVISPGNLRELQALSRYGTRQLRRLQVVPFARFGEVLTWFTTGGPLPLPEAGPATGEGAAESLPNFDDMVLTTEQETLAMTCAAGRHNLLLRGSPGTGKSMFAARLPSLLLAMPGPRHMEALQIHSNGPGPLAPPLLRGVPPFRSPHHGASAAAVLGTPDEPGEISLAHGGILFLDELPEFRRDLLEALREPLETGEVRVARARRKVTWQADIILVAACNNCPCGWAGSPRRRCQCPTQKAQAYNQRLSGPVQERIDLHFNMPENSQSPDQIFAGLHRPDAGQGTTERLRRSVADALEFAAPRHHSLGVSGNSELTPPMLEASSGLKREDFLTLIRDQFPAHLSGRAVTRGLRVARTLADLEKSPAIRKAHLIQSRNWQADLSARDRGEATGIAGEYL